MKILGLNCDPLRPDHSVDEVADTGCHAVRIVLRRDIAVLGAVQRYAARGIKVLGVIARESLDGQPSYEAGAHYYATTYGSLVSWYSVGNEPDVNPADNNGSSWVMTGPEYQQLSFAFRDCQSQVSPGLASGIPTAAAPYINFRDPICIHYPQGDAKVNEYKRWATGRVIWVTEGFYDSPIIRSCLTEAEAYWAWYHSPTPDLGIQGHPDRIAAFTALCKEFTVPEKPAFHWGFKDYADAHPEIGAALSEERYFAPDVSCQVAEGGLLVYAAQSNTVICLPAKKV